MLNQVVIVGRINNKLKRDNGVDISLKVPRSYKNTNGEYDNDYITATLFGMVADNAINYCNIGDIVGIKARIEQLNSLDAPRIIVEKLTYLTSKKEGE